MIRGGREDERGKGREGEVGGRDGREERTDGREGGSDVMALMKWVHMAWKGCIIGNPSEAR